MEIIGSSGAEGGVFIIFVTFETVFGGSKQHFEQLLTTFYRSEWPVIFDWHFVVKKCCILKCICRSKRELCHKPNGLLVLYLTRVSRIGTPAGGRVPITTPPLSAPASRPQYLRHHGPVPSAEHPRGETDRAQSQVPAVRPG